MDYSAMIQYRKSVRAFLDTPVPAAALDEINEYFYTDCKKLIPNIDVGIRIFKSDVKQKLEGNAGYHELMIGAPCYLVVLSEDAEYDTENAGYVAEDLVLKITELNLSSCWLTVCNPETVKKALGIQSDKHIEAVIAFGYGRRTPKKIRLNITNMSKVDVSIERAYYSPRLGIDDLVFAGKWGEKTGVDAMIGDMNSTLWRALYAASLAPSYLNRQPYGFVLVGGKVVLVAKQDEYTDEISEKLNLGIIMLHFAGVLSQRLYDIPWVMGDPQLDLGLPEGCRAVAVCKVYD